MARLRVFPVWQLVPRSIELEIAPGTLLRDALSDAFGILGERLEGVDRKGAELALDVAAPDLPELPDLALSLRPILHPLGLFEEAFSSRSPGAGAALVDSAGEGLTSWPLMTEPEVRLATGLQALGFGLDLSTLDLERLASSFPELEGGWGMSQSSPYRFLIAAAAILSESEMASLERLDASTEKAAEWLWTRLKLTEPDALDTRLHLFCGLTNGDATLLRKYLDEPGSAEIPGRVRRGWRRVVVHPYRDDADRLRQMANLGRRLSVERRNSRLRRDLQNACSEYVTRYSENACLDHQAQVSIRPFEEKLLVQAQQLLLDRLARRLSDVEGASSGLAADLAFGMLRRCGFFERQFETDGLRIGEVAWQLAAGPLRQRDRDLGGPIESLDPGTDGTLRDWIRSLGASPLALLAQADLDRIGKTVALDVACRLRFEIETLLETRTFPPEVPAEIDFAQFLATLEQLRGELDLLRAPHTSGKLSSWLSDQETRLGAEVQRLIAQVVSAADFLFSVPSRFLARLGMGDQGRYRRLAEAIEELRRTWLEWHCLQILLSGLRRGELAGLFDFASDLTVRFGVMAQEIAVLKDEMAQEIQEREKLEVLGAMALESPLFPELEERLRRAIDELPLDAAFRKVFRRNGQLRNLFRLRPEVVLQELMDELEEFLLAAVREIMAGSPAPQLSELLAAAIDQLFVAALVQHSGRGGSVGAFDHQTHLCLILSPELARQFAEGEDLVPRIRRHLGEIGVSQELPISLQSSPDVPGLILVRCVHALEIEELAG